jgi:hypothetical protein
MLLRMSGHDEEQEPGTNVVKFNTGVTVDFGSVAALVSRMVGYPIEQAAGILGDLLGSVRFGLSIRLLERAQRKLANAGIEQEALPAVDLSRLLPILEWGSVASDSGLQDQWANLLSNALVDPDGVPPSYPDILRLLTPQEAAILNGIYEQAGETWMESAYEPEIIAIGLGFPSGERVILAAENLLRLRLVRSRSLTFPGATEEDSKLILTHLGHDFVEMCRPPTQRP